MCRSVFWYILPSLHDHGVIFPYATLFGGRSPESTHNDKFFLLLSSVDAVPRIQLQ